MSLKQDLINQVAEKTLLSKKDSGMALEAITTSIKEKDESAQIMDFGAFETRQRAERKGLIHELVKKLQSRPRRYLPSSQEKN